jgi:hypothetical protein
MKLTLRYNNQTNRIVQTYWGTGSPDWGDNQQDGTTVTTTETTQQTRSDALNSALNGVEAGTDYDPDTETPVGKLCYGPDKDELYGEVEIQPLNG